MHGRPPLALRSSPVTGVQLDTSDEDPRRSVKSGLARRKPLPSLPMCGIVGYVGPRDGLEVVLDGLRLLEYRGYDSAGIAVIDRAGLLQVAKTAGRIEHLEKELAGRPVSGRTGIGHTRWASHGAPNDRNAHPHTDRSGRIAVVHNGIIENHGELRATLEAEGVEFASETDTEVVAHLVARTLRAATSVSVSLANTTPSASNAARSSPWFSMMPLWTTAIRPLRSVCGWALRSLGAPWVAHRVCPIPVVPLTGRPASSFSRFSIRPAFLATCNVPKPSMTAIPAESYPRYSSSRRPLRKTSNASRGPT